ncbi:hypothetical protein [Vagococcus sp. WN89Y]|uniref:hypothetical protein n=1 Tax=Vagococcus sp. WN89Y TaxID=3457258 RepID=UPI003FCD3887
MTVDPVLLLGGSGAIGHQAARALRAIYPDIPLMIGGRNLARAQGSGGSWRCAGCRH